MYQHSTVSKFIASILILFAASALSSEVSTAWLDSLEANLWRLETGMEVDSYRLIQVKQKLDKNNQPKGSDTTYYLVEIGENAEKIFHKTDSNGIIVKRNVRIEENENNGENQASKKEDDSSLQLNPFDPIKQEYRAIHSFHLLDPDQSGKLIIAYEPIEGAETGFSAKMTIDTTLWVAEKIEGHPAPLPSKVKEMEFTIEFVPDDNGGMRVFRTNTRVYAKLLLLKFRIRILENYFDYR